MGTALILAIITLIIGILERGLGRTMLERPMITSLIVGMVLGDIQAGVKIGATLELAFVGLFAIGAAIPPEIMTGGIIATALAITSGSGADTALVLAFPIASLALLIRNLYLIIIAPLFLHKADNYAEQGNFKGVEFMHIITGTGIAFILSIIVFVSYAVGADYMESFVDMIPSFVQTGLEVAAGILPALGFAILGRSLINKKVVPYFFIGFALLAYLDITVIGIAILGLMVALVVVNIENNNLKPQNEGGIDEDEDF